jgi:PAS domain S-box-containing protein
MKTNNESNFYKLGQVAKILQVHPNTLRSWDRDGTLSSVRLGATKHRRYPRSIIDNFLITKIKPAEYKIKSSDSNDYYKKFLEGLPQLIWTCNSCGQCTYLSPQWENFTGISANKQLGDKWLKQIHPDDTKRVIKTWKESVKTGRDLDVEFRIRRFDGKYIWHKTLATAIRNYDGSIALWFGSNTNIHTLRKGEEQKDSFLSMASHELKTPLTSIKGYAQLIRIICERENNSKVLDLLEKQKVSIEKLNSLISDLLDLSKITSGNLSYQEEVFSFKELLRRSIDTVQTTTDSHKIILKGKTFATIYADRERIDQVISNLLTNAIKYSPKAEKILVRVSEESGNVKVCIEDFGVGIPEEDQDKVFIRFYRTLKTKKIISGLGIGLYICREIINHHKGKLWFTSEDDKGSKFYFTLPLYQADPLSKNAKSLVSVVKKI